MRTIRYGLHFSILGVAVVIFWLARDVDFPAQILNYRAFHYGLMGILHAASVVVSLRDRRIVRPATSLAFISLAAVWSAATPLFALWGGAVTWGRFIAALPPNPTRAMFLFLLTGSAIGSAGYWMFARLFWFRSFTSVDFLKTVGLCAIGTSLAFAACTLLPLGKNNAQGADLLELALTAVWWFVFSISLYWSEMSKRVGESRVDAQTGKLTVN
jgi:hypothetical protein